MTKKENEEVNLYCKRCGRPLKDEISRKVGYGPECFKKIKPKNKKIIKE
jgi:hypothetical protein